MSWRSLHADPREFEFGEASHQAGIDRSRFRGSTIYFAAIALANNPNMRAEGEFGHLEAIRAEEFVRIRWHDGHLITDDDLLALSVRRGSLTPNERREIEAHVRIRENFSRCCLGRPNCRACR